jgi:Spy/CpxP family protein refolding chaperone
MYPHFHEETAMRLASLRTAVWRGLATLAVLAADTSGAAAAEKKAEGGKAKAAAGERKAKAPRGRLPAYYAEVVDEKQREAIYKIQQEYEPKIADLRAQLDKLTKEREAKVTAVLTPEQQKKVAELQAAAKAKRDAKKPTDKPPAKRDSGANVGAAKPAEAPADK